jgi:rod shape-determining protein MreC
MRISPKLKIGIIVIALITAFVFLNLTGFSKPVKNFFYSFSQPIQKTLWKTGDNVSDFFGGILEIKIMKKELEAVYLENQALRGQIAALKELKKENEDLRNALNIGLEKDFELELAQITGKDVSQDSILVDKGSKDGILKGFPVITSQKILLGRIGEVYENFSEVILISNKDSSFSAEIQDKDASGIVKGEGNLRLYLDLIPKNKEISKGEFVITTALGGIFPKGILVGEITEVKKTDIQPFQTAEIKPSFKIEELDSVFIIKHFAAAK